MYQMGLVVDSTEHTEKRAEDDLYSNLNVTKSRS